MNESFRLNTLLGKITQSIVLVFQIVAIIVFIASIFLGFSWLSRPFIGGFFEQTMVLNGSDTREPGSHWSLYAQGFQLGDQLISVNDQPVSTSGDVAQALRSLQVGQNIPVELVTTAGEMRTANVILQSLPAVD